MFNMKLNSELYHKLHIMGVRLIPVPLIWRTIFVHSSYCLGEGTNGNCNLNTITTSSSPSQLCKQMCQKKVLQVGRTWTLLQQLKVMARWKFCQKWVAIHGIVQGLCKPHLLPELSVQRTRPFSIHMYSLPWVSEWCDSCFQTLPQN